MDKEKEENIWNKKICFFVCRRSKMEKGNILFAAEKKNREGKGRKYLEKENICFAEEKKDGEGKVGKYLGMETYFMPRRIF